MQGFEASAVIAVLLGVMALPLALIPYVAWSYGRGTTGPGHALLAASGVVYLLALWTYTIAPLPQVADLVCDGTVRAQLVPFAFLGDIERNGGIAGLLGDPALRQVLLNVAFFVPFGILARHLMGWRARWCVLAALSTSLLIELTQLTGNWFSYPCAYRLFDADDLLANTFGAAIGIALAPMARLVPGQYRTPTDTPQPVRPTRRVAGMAVDLVSVLLVGAGIPLGVRVALYLTDHAYDWHSTLIRVMATIAAVLVLLVIVPNATGATLGQHLVHLRAVRRGGREPQWHQWVIRALTGTGAYALISLPGDIGLVDGTGLLAPAWALLAVTVVVFVDTRGVSGFASGLVIVDDREPPPAHPRAGTDPRRLSSAVLLVGAATYVLIAALVTLAALSPIIGAALIGLVLVGLVVADLALVGYLMYTGVVVLRREGRSPANALPLAALTTVLALLALLALGLALDLAPAVVVAVSGLAVAAHLALLLGAFVLYGAVYARQRERPGADAIVVLGSRVFGDRVPPLLAARIDLGVRALERELAEGRRPLLVLSGGQGPDEEIAEGRAMAAYALDNGAPEDLVRVEDRSRSTEENLTFSRDLVQHERAADALVVATNDYHAFRAAIIARELDLDAQVVGAPTARYYFPAAVLREFVGVLSRSPALHGGLLVAVAVSSAMLTHLALGG